MHLNFELRLLIFRPNGTEVHSLQKKSFLCFQFVQLNFDLGSELEYEVLVDDLLMIFGPILNLSGFWKRQFQQNRDVQQIFTELQNTQKESNLTENPGL